MLEKTEQKAKATARPTIRPRRLRRLIGLRNLVAETRLSVDDLMYPLFVTEDPALGVEIQSMPGIRRHSLNSLTDEIDEILQLGIPAVLLFGIPKHKDSVGSEAFAEDGIVQRAIRLVKEYAPELVVASDVCLCQYTDHGHCGVILGDEVRNDETLELLAKTAVSQAAAGADVVAPSAMMDGQVRAVREALDSSGYQKSSIMAYSAKYASAFYGPFREAAQSTPHFGDRRGYQMDPPNIREAMREIRLDIEEGADVIMVKPALAYLDVIREARRTFHHPLAAYSVSGEYTMLKAAALNGWLDEQDAMTEVLTSIKRAGADLIITYFAKTLAKLVQP